METVTSVGNENKTLDVFKFLACVIIAATHLPSMFESEIENFYFNQWFFRFCVPFFYVSSGYFFYKTSDKLRTIRRIFWLYAFSYVLYLPAVLEGAYDLNRVISKLRWNLVIGYEHLWYLNSTLQGFVIWYILEKTPVISKIFRKIGISVCVLLILLGALLDEHYHLLGNGLFQRVGDFLLIFGGPRNVVFMGFPLLVLGGAVARYEAVLRKLPALVLILLWVVIRALAWWECTYLLKALGSGITNDLTFFGCWPALILFMLSFKFQIPIPEAFAKLLRRMAEYIYVLHPLIAALISKYIPLAPTPLWLSTIALCSLIYILLEKQFVLKK